MVCVSHCVSTLSPAGSQLSADMPHVPGLIGASYLPPGERCYQCDESDGFDRVSAGVPLVRRAQRRRRDTRRLASNITRLPVRRIHKITFPGHIPARD